MPFDCLATLSMMSPALDSRRSWKRKDSLKQVPHARPHVWYNGTISYVELVQTLRRGSQKARRDPSKIATSLERYGTMHRAYYISYHFILGSYSTHHNDDDRHLFHERQPPPAMPLILCCLFGKQENLAGLSVG